MEVEVRLPDEISSDVLVVPVVEGAEEPSGGARMLDERLQGRLGRLAESGEIRGELGHTVVLHLDGELGARRLAAVGIGPGRRPQPRARPYPAGPGGARARARFEELGRGARAAVGRASASEPRLIVLRYDPPEPARPDMTLGLVGKAITFDSGGISLKPALKMYDMKGDMAGGAAVVAGIAAIADLGLPVRTIAVVAAAENLVGGNAFRPGDILTAANGKTIAITNTDAEGRPALCRAVCDAR